MFNAFALLAMLGEEEVEVDSENEEELQVMATKTDEGGSSAVGILLVNAGENKGQRVKVKLNGLRERGNSVLRPKFRVYSVADSDTNPRDVWKSQVMQSPNSYVGTEKVAGRGGTKIVTEWGVKMWLQGTGQLHETGSG